MCIRDRMYSEPSGPWAKPMGLYFASLVLITVSTLVNPSANTSQSPVGFPFSKGIKQTIYPVSYTHLDVYKRQRICCAPIVH